MLRQATIGLLPCYIALYDEIVPKVRAEFAPFLDTIAARFAAAGVHVVRTGICCVAREFRQAVAQCEAAGVDALVTVHLAYSPSEEALGALCATSLPLILLDTTMDEHFGPEVDPARLMYNHGIHGVQDLASLLRRWRRPYQVVAGHVTASDVVERAAALAQAAVATREFRGSRALRVGFPFQGMGDFSVAPELLASQFRLTVDAIAVEDLAADAAAVAPADIAAELAADQAAYDIACPAAVHERSVRVGLALRHRLTSGRYGAFSMNFQAFRSPTPPIDTVPFLEASKAMARGVGYAGEGDVLTAALVGALQRAFGRTTFTEIFCPDWAGNRLFLSHMGEINPAVVAGRLPMLEKPYPFSPTQNPAFITGAPAAGPGVYVNLSPGPDGSFRLILCPVEVLGDSPRAEYRGLIRGWFRSALPVAEFLEAYSRAGGTHHSALVLGHRVEPLRALAGLLGMECLVIG
jgi:L-arabinose isomerase